MRQLSAVALSQSHLLLSSQTLLQLCQATSPIKFLYLLTDQRRTATTTTNGLITSVVAGTVPQTTVTLTTTIVLPAPLPLMKRQLAVPTPAAVLPPTQLSVLQSVQNCGITSVQSALSSACSCLNIPTSTVIVDITLTEVRKGCQDRIQLEASETNQST